jgi:hypothetical protein
MPSAIWNFVQAAATVMACLTKRFSRTDMNLITNLLGRFIEQKRIPKRIGADEKARQFWMDIDNIVPMSSAAPAGAALGLTIILGATKCFDAARAYIKWEDAQADWYRQWFVVKSEFFCLFIHLANRRFYSAHGETIGGRWQRELALGYLTQFIARWFDTAYTWPSNMSQEAKRGMEEFRARMRSELMHNINVAEVDYSTCRELFAEYDGKGCGVGGVFGKLVQNLIKAGCIDNPLSQFAIENAVFDVFLTMGLWHRVDHAAEELIARPAAA